MLIRILDKLADETMANHDNVDFGGCCVVAAHVGHHLSRNNVPVKIRVLNTNDPIDIDKARKEHSPKDKWDWENAGLDFHHVVCEFRHNNRRYVYDTTDGVRLLKELKKQTYPVLCTGALTVKEARKLADTDDWNCAFDRRQIPHIRRRIANHLKRLS